MKVYYIKDKLYLVLLLANYLFKIKQNRKNKSYRIAEFSIQFGKKFELGNKIITCN